MDGRRLRRGEQGWRSLMARYEESGLSVSAFCKRERLNVASFYHWRSRLGRASPGVVATEPQGRFVDLGGLGGSRVEIRMELGGGLVLHLVRG